ncbi:MAG: hypothetical protein R2697_01230 [Ilumatobacteraceae bacterium]
MGWGGWGDDAAAPTSGSITATAMPVSHSGIGEYASASPGQWPRAAAVSIQARTSLAPFPALATSDSVV